MFKTINGSCLFQFGNSFRAKITSADCSAMAGKLAKSIARVVKSREILTGIEGRGLSSREDVLFISPTILE